MYYVVVSPFFELAFGAGTLITAHGTALLVTYGLSPSKNTCLEDKIRRQSNLTRLFGELMLVDVSLMATADG